MQDIREPQKKALQSLLAGPVTPPVVVVQGATNTGKSYVLSDTLNGLDLPHTWIQCNQCPTVRVMLQRALSHIFQVLDISDNASCENIDIFFDLLASKFSNDIKHILVLDNFDEMPDTRQQSDLMYGLTRFHETYPVLQNFTVVFVYSRPEPKAIVSNMAIPRIFFKRYTHDESLEILKQSDILNDIDPQFRNDFLELVVNALSPFLGSDIPSLKRAALKIYPDFVGEGSVAMLYNRKPYLFQMEFVIDQLRVDGADSHRSTDEFMGGFMLCAAYLASYNPPRYDMRCFSLAKNMRNKRRETHAKKSVTIPLRSLTPPTFEMERMLAIFHAILPNANEHLSDVRCMRVLATLTAQNLIQRGQNDVLDSRTKWKINAPWDYVQLVASQVGFDIEMYLVDDV